jgi:hypothetical protein
MLGSVFGSGLGVDAPMAGFLMLGASDDIGVLAEYGLAINASITAAEAGLSVAGGDVLFNPSLATAAGLSEADAFAVGRIVGVLNAHIDAGLLTLGPGSSGWQVIGSATPAIVTGPLFSVTVGTIEMSCTVTTHWYGIKIHLNKGLTQKIAELAGAGAATSTIAALLKSEGVIIPVGGPTLAALALALAASGAFLKALDFCNGVNIVLSWVNPTIPVYLPA